jgi:hypothetical protein
MDTESRREILICALASSAAAVPLAYGFSHGQLESWWRDQPVSLVLLFAVGIVLSLAAAALLQYRRVPQFSRRSLTAEVIGGSLFGALIGLAASGVGWVIPETSLWALLLWFPVGAMLIAAMRSIFPKRANRAG